MKRMLLLACCLAALPAAAPGNSAIAAFNEAFAGINDYTVTIHEFEAYGDRTQNRTYDFWFMRPAFIKTQITAGDGKGSGAVWNGGDKISGHQGGLLSFIHLKVGLRDSRATTLRGYTIPEGSMQAQVAKYTAIKGRLSERKGPAMDGVATIEVELIYADPSSQEGATRALMYFSSVTHFPLRQVQYEGDKVVGDESFVNLKTNVGLRGSDFPF